MDRLFDPAEPDSPRRATPTSSPYELLVRSQGRAAVRVRALLEAWWFDLPLAARPQVRERLRSPLPVIHLGAFWELYTHASLRGLFGEVSVDVGEDHLERRRPDFSLGDRDGGVWFEATAVAGDDFVDRGERPRVQQFYALLERSSNRNFLLHLQLFSVGPSTPGRRLLVQIEGWLNSLDWESELRRKEAGKPPPSVYFDAMVGRSRSGPAPGCLTFVDGETSDWWGRGWRASARPADSGGWTRCPHFVRRSVARPSTGTSLKGGPSWSRPSARAHLSMTKTSPRPFSGQSHIASAAGATTSVADFGWERTISRETAISPLC
jgi:hypothetical protein